LHEIGIVKAMVKTVLDYAAENGVDSVSEIVMDVGELSLVVPDYLEKLYPVVVKDTPLKDTRLVIEIVPGLAECEDCDAVFNVVECEGICPDCGSQNKTVLSGKDCTIKEIHVPE
jgi:hydrogenase nickel incorporation protein HypA/HybF